MKDPYKTTFETWNKIATLYEEKFMDLTIYNESYDLFLKHLSCKNASILEIGCGPGNITRYLLDNYHQLQILGIDTSENMLKLAQKNNPSAKFKLLDCRDLSSLNTRFDGIIGGFFLPYIASNDLKSLLKDCTTLLNSFGIIYLSFIEGDFKKSGFEKGSTGDLSFVYYYEESFIKNLLFESGFHIISVLRKEFERNNGQQDVHLIILAKKQ